MRTGRGNRDIKAPLSYNARVVELQNRLENLVRFGVIEEIQYDPPFWDVPQGASARVRLGSLLTQWLPWLQMGSTGHAVQWTPLAVGDPVIVLSPSGDPTQGVILPGLYRDGVEPAQVEAGREAQQHVTEYADGAIVKYDRQRSRYEINLPQSGSFVVNVGNTSLVLENGRTILTTPNFVGRRS